MIRIVAGWLFCVVVLLGSVEASRAALLITDDRGGRIGTYVDKYEELRTSSEPVVIDGLCASACTIVLGKVSPDRICVTSRANLGFHAAWDPDAEGRPVTNSEATRMLFSMYPARIKHWILRRGGLTPRMIFLHGRELSGMYRPCSSDMDANASANPLPVRAAGVRSRTNSRASAM